STRAAVRPAGPPPTITTSKRLWFIPPPRECHHWRHRSRRIIRASMGRADNLAASSDARDPSASAAASSRGRRDSLSRAIPPLPSGRAGDPGRFGPASVVWRIHRERALLLSAPAVALMQLAHPLVAAAIADHTNRDRSVVERAGATIGLNLAVIFGDRDQADRAALHVRDLHTAL